MQTEFSNLSSKDNSKLVLSSVGWLSHCQVVADRGFLDPLPIAPHSQVRLQNTLCLLVRFRHHLHSRYKYTQLRLHESFSYLLIQQMNTLLNSELLINKRLFNNNVWVFTIIILINLLQLFSLCVTNARTDCYSKFPNDLKTKKMPEIAYCNYL